MPVKSEVMKGIKNSEVYRSSKYLSAKSSTRSVQKAKSKKDEPELVYISRPRRIRFSDQERSVSILFQNKADFKPSTVDLSNEQYLRTLRGRSYTPPSSKGKAKRHHVSDSTKYPENPILRTQTLKEMRALLGLILEDPTKSGLTEEEPPKTTSTLLAEAQEMEDMLDREDIYWEHYNAQYKTRQVDGCGRPYWIDPDTGEMTCIPPTPPFIRKLKARPKDDAMTRLKRFRENEDKRHARERAVYSRAKTNLLKYERTLPITMLFHHKYDSDLVQILRDDEGATVLTKKQRADMRHQLKKRDELLAYELTLLKQTKENIMKRCSKFKTVADAYQKRVYQPEPGKKLKEGLNTGDNAILYGEGLTLAIERRESLLGGSLLGHFGSASSTTISTRRPRPAHRCKKYRNLTIFTTSGQVTGSEDESVFARLSQKSGRRKARQIKTYHCLIEARHQLQRQARLNAKKDGSKNAVEITEAPIEFLKDPRPTEGEADSEDEREFTEEDLQFLSEIREKHHINEGDCGLIHPGVEIHETMQEIRVAERYTYHFSAFLASEPPAGKAESNTFSRKTPYNIEEQLEIERHRNYNIAMSVFPRRGAGLHTTCKDHFQPEFWKGFCVNKYNLESNAGPIDPKTGKGKNLDFLRHVFQVQRLEDAHPLDKSPEVLYYRLLPSQLGMVGVPDPDPDELFPKPFPERTAFNYIPNNSPVFRSSPEPIIFANEEFGPTEKGSTTSTDHKAEFEHKYGKTLTRYPFRRMMDKFTAFKKKQEAHHRFMEQKLAEILKARQDRKLKIEPEILRKIAIEVDTVGHEETLRQIRAGIMASSPFAHHTVSLISHGRSRSKSSRKSSRQPSKLGRSRRSHSLSTSTRETLVTLYDRSYDSDGSEPMKTRAGHGQMELEFPGYQDGATGYRDDAADYRSCHPEVRRLLLDSPFVAGGSLPDKTHLPQPKASKVKTYFSLKEKK